MAEPENTETKPAENPVENWLDAEDKATDALDPQREHPSADDGVAKDAMAETPEETPEKPEEPPAELPPDETPPAPIEEPEKPTPVEAKPAEPEKPKPWAELRAAQREKKDLEARLKAQEDELAKLRTKPAEAEIEEVYQPPATRTELEQLRTENDAKIEQIRQAEQSRIMIDAIAREEQAFEREHPDYKEAVDYIQNVQQKEFELSGQLGAIASDLIQNHADEVEKIATQYNVDPDQCAKDLAFKILFDNRKRDFAMRNVGKVAKSAYDLAQAYGYKPKGTEPVKEEPKTPPGPTPQEKVQRAIKNQAVTQSISAMTPAGGSRSNQITTRAELMSLDPDTRDNMIDQMDARNPNWLKELEE